MSPVTTLCDIFILKLIKNPFLHNNAERLSSGARIFRNINAVLIEFAEPHSGVCILLKVSESLL